MRFHWRVIGLRFFGLHSIWRSALECARIFARRLALGGRRIGFDFFIDHGV
jgi:DNA-binding ferritin-like protein